MRKLVITCMFVSASMAVFAQNKVSKTTKTSAAAATTTMVDTHDLTPAEVKNAQQKAEKKSKAMQAKLGLTQDQYEKVYEAESRYQKNYAMYPAGKIPAGFLSNITSERDKFIQAALTEAQYEKYKGTSK